jgi:SAM-dependent methyltransferase
LSEHDRSTASTPARHQEVAVSTSRQLAWKWLRQGKVHMPLLFLSNFGRHLITRKYDAFTTDLAYENRAKGSLIAGKLLDRYVLNQSLHEGLRQRLVLVADELVAGIRERAAAGSGPVLVVSGPSGLTRDLITAHGRLQSEFAPPNVEWVAVDLDHSGEVLDEARRRCAVAGIDLATHKVDLLAPDALGQALGGRKADLFNSIGLTAWLGMEDVERLFASISEALAPGGTFIVDNFHEHSESKYGDAFEMATRYHPDGEFETALRASGFEPVSKRVTANKVNVVYRARKA